VFSILVYLRPFLTFLAVFLTFLATFLAFFLAIEMRLNYYRFSPYNNSNLMTRIWREKKMIDVGDVLLFDF